MHVYSSIHQQHSSIDIVLFWTESLCSSLHNHCVTAYASFVKTIGKTPYYYMG